MDRTGGGDAFDAGFLDAWLGRCALDTCLERGLQSAAIILGQIGPQYQSDARALNVFRAQRQRCPETDSTRGSSMRKPVITFLLFWIMR